MDFDERCFVLATEYKSIKELKSAASKIEAICDKYGSENENKPFIAKNQRFPVGK